MMYVLSAWNLLKGGYQMKIKIIDFGYQHLPKRAHANDAGADVYSMRKCIICPQETVKIPLGLGLVLPDGYAAYVFPRSGLSSKGITCELPPIDSGYRGEYMAPVTNVNDKPLCIVKKEVLETWDEDQKEKYILYPYEKAVCQGVLLKMPQLESETLSYDELKKIASLRNDGRLGSSGK